MVENVKEADVCDLGAEMAWFFSKEKAWVVDQCDSTPMADVVIHQKHEVHSGGACYRFTQLLGNVTCISYSPWLTLLHHKYI